MLKIINPILGILFINQVLMGLLHGLVSPKVFEVMHEKGGIIFAIAAILHVALNWGWVKANLLRKKPATK